MALGVKMESLDGLNYEAEFRENNYSPETVLNYPKPYAPRCKRRILFGQQKRLSESFDTNVPSPIQPASVVRRNERERNRVRMVNNGFATLRQHVPNGVKNKKMSKVETLKSAVDYIKQLQELLTQSEATSVVKSETRKDDFDFERENRANFDSPSVGRRCAERDAIQTTGNYKYHYDNNCYDNFVPDNANVNQNYTNGQASFYSSNGSPTLSWPSSDTSSPGNHEHQEENILAFSSWFS